MQAQQQKIPAAQDKEKVMRFGYTNLTENLTISEIGPVTWLGFVIASEQWEPKKDSIKLQCNVKCRVGTYSFDQGWWNQVFLNQ